MFTSNFSSQLDDQITTQIDKSKSQQPVSQQPAPQKIMFSPEETNPAIVNLPSPLGAEVTKEICVDINPCLDMFNDNFNISEVLTNLYAKVSEASYITQYDRELIKLSLLQENLKEEEHRIINRLLYSIRRGWIELVDDVHSTLVFDQSRRFLQGLNSVA